jgi:hypothetical protein
MDEPALSVGATSVWRLCGACVARVALGQTKRHPPEPLSCKGLRHVWRVRHLFFTFWGRTKSRKKILRTATATSWWKIDPLTTRHTCHTCLNALCHKGFRVRRFGSTCSTQAPPCTQSATLAGESVSPAGHVYWNLLNFKKSRGPTENEPLPKTKLENKHGYSQSNTFFFQFQVHLFFSP